MNVADALQRNVAGVSLTEVTGNPFQPNVEFRGFVASPVSGTPQGLAVYQNGVRINEAFGDTMNWDLIPTAAIRSVSAGRATSVDTDEGRLPLGDPTADPGCAVAAATAAELVEQAEREPLVSIAGPGQPLDLRPHAMGVAPLLWLGTIDPAVQVALAPLAQLPSRVVGR